MQPIETQSLSRGANCHELFAINPPATTLVLVFPTWAGITEFEREVASRLVEQGHDAIIIDYHGDKADLSTMEGRQLAMGEMLRDFELFRQSLERLMTDLGETLRGYRNLVSLGYCLGGLCSIQLGLILGPLKAAISFHGLLSSPKTLSPLSKSCRFLILNGSADPMVPTRDITETLGYFDKHDLDMTFVSFSHTQHSFAIPGSHNPQAGVMYHPTSDKRSWRYAMAHLTESIEGSTTTEQKP